VLNFSNGHGHIRAEYQQVRKLPMYANFKATQLHLGVSVTARSMMWSRRKGTDEMILAADIQYQAPELARYPKRTAAVDFSSMILERTSS